MDFQRVLLREMGHRIGLGHIERGKSIMASSADRARCIDELTIAKLLTSFEPKYDGPEAFCLYARKRSLSR